MNWNTSPYALISLLAAVTSVALAYYARKQRPTAGAVSLTLLGLVIAEWSLGYALEMSAVDLSAKLFWAKIQYLGIVFAPMAWFTLSLEYIGRKEWLKARNLILLAAIPLTTILFVWTNDQLIWSQFVLDTSGPFPAFVPTYAIWFWVHSAYSYALMLLGSLILVSEGYRRSLSLYRWQTTALLTSALLPWLGNALYIFGHSRLDLTPLSFSVSGMIIAWAIFRLRLFQILPVARRNVIDNMSDGMLTLDGEGRIVDINPAAQLMIGLPLTQLFGQPISQIVADAPELLRRSRDPDQARIEIDLGELGAQRRYDLRISSLFDHRQNPQGHLILFQDITGRTRAEQERERLFQRNTALIQALGEIVYERRPQANAILWDGAYQRILGYSAAEMGGDSASWTSRVHPDDLPQLLQELRQAREERRNYDLEYRFQQRNGSYLWMHDRGVLLFDDSGELTTIIGVMRDISDRKQKEVDRRAHVRFQSLLNDITRAALETSDLSATLQILADRLGELFNADGCYITQWDETTQQTLPRAAFGQWRQDYQSVTVQPGEKTLTQSVVQARRPLIIEDVSDTPYLSPRIAELFPDRSLIGLPLLAKIGSGDQSLPLGAALIAFNQPQRFTPEQVARAEQAAALISLAVAKAYLLERSRIRWHEAEMLRQAAAAVTATLNLDETLAHILEQLDKVLQADAVALLLIDEAQDELYIQLQKGFSEENVEGMRLPLQGDRGVAAFAARTGQPVYVPDTSLDPRYIAAGFDGKSELAAPLQVKGNTIGVLDVESVHPNAYTENDLKLLTAFANQAAIAIDHARLVEGLEAKVSIRTAEIAAERDKNEIVLRSIGDAIAMVDLDMGIQYVNTAFTNLTGYTPNEVLGQPMSIFVGEGMSDQDRQFLYQAIEKDSHWQGEIRARRKSGAFYDAVMTLAPVISAAGELQGYITSHQDISPLKELDRARHRFMSNVSHELRTPVTNIQLYARLLRIGNNPEKTNHYLEVLSQQAARLEDLILDILEMTSLDSGHREMSWAQVPLHTIIDTAVTPYRAKAADARLILSVIEPASDLPPVKGDLSWLIQAVSKLVQNAVAFTPAGGQVAVSAELAEDEQGSWVTITVRDSGPGMTPEVQARVFDRFYRGTLAESGHIPGTGLGLSVVKEIMRAHRGRVTVDSQVGQGTAFTIWLPVDR